LLKSITNFIALALLTLPVTAFDQAVPSGPTDTSVKAPAGFNPVPTGDVLDFFNARPTTTHAFRVLFIGDSLTFHSPAPKLWTYYAGMAASDAAHDFVHLTAAHMQSRMGDRPVEIFYSHGGGKIGAMLTYLQQRPELAPNLIVLQGGENDPFDDTFYKNYRGLLDIFPGTARIVLSDWANTAKRDFELKEAKQRHLPFIDLTMIKAEPRTIGNGGPFNHPGVAWHPNDHGMARIAEEINKVFDSSILPTVKTHRH
jgi:hypothetical protein